MKNSYEFSNTPEISFNYQGEFEKKKYTSFNEVDLSGEIAVASNLSPDFLLSHKINIVGMTLKGQLHFLFGYNKYEKHQRVLAKNTSFSP